jgi:hypothetical protein
LTNNFVVVKIFVLVEAYSIYRKMPFITRVKKPLPLRLRLSLLWARKSEVTNNRSVTGKNFREVLE